MRKLLAASRRSPGNAAAPATTLNRMYHCVPRIISGVSQISAFRWKCTMKITNGGNSRLAGNAARNCASGCARRAQMGRSPSQTPIGTQIEAGQHNQNHDTDQRDAAQPDRLAHVRQVSSPETNATIWKSAHTTMAASASIQMTSMMREGCSCAGAADAGPVGGASRRSRPRRHRRRRRGGSAGACGASDAAARDPTRSRQPWSRSGISATRRPAAGTATGRRPGSPAAW